MVDRSEGYLSRSEREEKTFSSIPSSRELQIFARNSERLRLVAFLAAFFDSFTLVHRYRYLMPVHALAYYSSIFYMFVKLLEQILEIIFNFPTPIPFGPSFFGNKIPKKLCINFTNIPKALCSYT